MFHLSAQEQVTGGNILQPAGLSEQGIMVGQSYFLPGGAYGSTVDWIKGGIFDGQLFTLGTGSTLFSDTLLDITNSTGTAPAVAVGAHFDSSSNYIQSLWIKIDGSWIRQDVIGGNNQNTPFRINKRFEILGSFNVGGYPQMLLNGKAINLTQAIGPGWSTDQFSGINGQGVIAGTATKTQNDDGSPIPLAQQVASQNALLPVEIKVTDRDDPKKKWADAKDHKTGKPIYAGESCGDMVSFKLGGTDSWSTTTFTWTAEGPNGATVTGPTGAGKNEWKIADGDADTATDWLKWKPGKWKIKVQMGSATAEFEQEVGQRTEQYLAVGSILGEAAPATGVLPRVVTQWDCPQIGMTVFSLGGNGVNDPTSNLYIPFESDDRVYVNHRLLNATANSDPQPDIRPELTVAEACGLKGVKHYRGFAACQYRFSVKDGKIEGQPIAVPGAIVDKIGSTPIPCTGANSYGSPGIASGDSGKMSVNSDKSDFGHITKFRVGKIGQLGFKRINGREIPWVFFRFRFKPDDGLLDSKISEGPSYDPNGPDSKDYSTVPTWEIFRRYYSLQEGKWKVELTNRIAETSVPFFSIGTVVPGSPYILP